jgi:glycosyltransferase involved in cell wall biosynthesis
MKRRLFASAMDHDVVHTHGFWTLPPTYGIEAAQRSGRPVICTAHGTLMRWQHDGSLNWKRPIWSVTNRRWLNRATCLHATSIREAKGFREAGLTPPIFVCPLGIELPALEERRASTSERRTALFLGRFSSQKGIDLLLHAWRTLQDEFPQWDLRLVGQSHGDYGIRMQALCRELGCLRVTFADPVFGDAKRLEFQRADLFVAFSYWENFGLVIAEALGHSVPVITTRATPWGEIENRQCGWLAECTVDSVATRLRLALSSDDETRRKMGANGRIWMEEDFSLEVFGRRLSEVYRWLINGGHPPPQCPHRTIVGKSFSRVISHPVHSEPRR